MSMRDISNSLYNTPISAGIRDVTWLIPDVQSVHILAIAMLVGCALVMEFRLAGVFSRDVAPGVVVRRQLPWLWAALAVLILTGSTLVLAEPNRVLMNELFWYKMIMVLAAFLITWIMHRPLIRSDAAQPSGLVKASAWIAIALWIAVIYCGRWIAYFIV